MPAALSKPLVRKLRSYAEKGKDVVVMIHDEGITFKTGGQRWASGVTISWAAAHSVAYKMEVARAAGPSRGGRRLVKRGLL